MSPITHDLCDTPSAIGTALLGVLITILEGILQLYQFSRSGSPRAPPAEALKHEKFMYLAKAGAYATAPNPLALLAERIETIGSQENCKWASIQQPQKVAKTGDTTVTHYNT